MKQQQRFMLALAASAAILRIWLYFFPPRKPPQNADANANANVQQSASPSASPTAQVAAATPAPAPATASPEATPETVPQRKLHIVTPLYKATFDTRGAVVTSWVLTKIKRSDGTLKDVYGASSTKTN